VLIAAAGIYAFTTHSGPGPGPVVPGQNGSPPPGNTLPASIKTFTVQGRNFTMQGDNLSRVEVWAVSGGKDQLLGVARLTTSGAGGMNDTWTLAIPGGTRGATQVYARGYDKAGNAAAKIDLPANFLGSL
jgi:hypothetical protein